MWWRASNCSPLLIYRPRQDERLSWPGWLTYSGRLTHISGHPSATGRAQDGERTLARDWRSTNEPCRPICISTLYVEQSLQHTRESVEWRSWSRMRLPCCTEQVLVNDSTARSARYVRSTTCRPSTDHIHQSVLHARIFIFIQHKGSEKHNKV